MKSDVFKRCHSEVKPFSCHILQYLGINKPSSVVLHVFGFGVLCIGPMYDAHFGSSWNFILITHTCECLNCTNKDTILFIDLVELRSRYSSSTKTCGKIQNPIIEKNTLYTLRVPL